MTTRGAYGIGLVAVCVILLSSIYLQIVDGVLPCPLCTLQRFAFGILGFLFLLGTLFAPKHLSALIINLFSLFVASLGIALAGRQVWLQHFQADAGGECGVSLQYMLQVLPLQEVAQKIFAGSAECSQRGFVFLALTTAEWALIWFVLFFGFSIYLLRKR